MQRGGLRNRRIVYYALFFKQMRNQRQDEENDEDVENDSGSLCGTGGDAPEAKHASNDGDDDKNKNPAEHSVWYG